MPDAPQRVVLVDLEIPFGDLVSLLITRVSAGIPAKPDPSPALQSRNRFGAALQ